MSSPSKAVEDEVQSFIKLMFPTFEVFRGSRDEIEAVIESEQGLGHVKKTNNSQDCCIQTNVHDQPTKTSFTGIGAKIGTSNVDKFYQENFNKYLYYCWIQQFIIPIIIRRSSSSNFHKF
jgi:hypothetical protein